VIGFFFERIRGWRVLALAAVAYAFGFFALNVLPQWNILVSAQGGNEIQAAMFPSVWDVRGALAQINAAGARDAALQFYLIDIPNFTLLGAAGATLIAFGLRRFGLDRGRARYLIIAPLFAAFADAMENASLAACFLLTDAFFAENAAYAITAKRVAMLASLALVLLAPAGLLWWTLQELKRPSPK